MSMALSPEQFFSWAGQLTLYGWVILILLPRVKVLVGISQYFIPLVIGLLYAGLMLVHFFNSDGGFGSLNDVRVLFENDHILLAGWLHYLAFDLFIGAWIARESDNLGISRLIQAPILLATYFLGPIGLVVFLSMRTFFSKTPTKATLTQTEENTYVS